MSIFTNFINGLRKSFSGKDYLRDVDICVVCNRPSFSTTCLQCETDGAFRQSNKHR